jgi:HAD superfamily hydrolase (TIGR01544 family)
VSFLFGDTTPLIPQGFLHSPTADIETKIVGFKQAGINQLQVVLDFDRTLTEKHNQDSTSWQLMRNHLPPEGQAEAQKVFDHYRAIEVAEKLTAEDAVAWWSESMAIITKYHLDMGVVEHDFLSRSTIRPGTKELFALCAQHNIPTIIMSAGIKDVIDIWCKAYDIRPTIILSTELRLDDENRVIGWYEDTIVHTLNKREIGHPELSKIRTERSHTILAGDSMHDFDMADGTDNVFRVRVVDLLEEEKSNQHEIHEKSLKMFDVVIEDGTLVPIVEFVERIVDR